MGDSIQKNKTLKKNMQHESQGLKKNEGLLKLMNQMKNRTVWKRLQAQLTPLLSIRKNTLSSLW